LKSASDIDSQDSSTGETLAKHLPSVDFELFAKTKASRRTEVATAEATSYAGQVVLKVPLFSGLSSVWERREAASRKKGLEEDRVIIWNRITTDLYKSYKDWDLAKAKEKAETVNLKLTSQKIRSADSSYRNGRATLTDVLDSYSQDLAARRNLAQAQLDKLRSFFAIRRLTGEVIDYESKESL
jgi:outer membrane protein TolC